jgi:hypothetical protein
VSVSICIPFRPDGAERDRNYAFVRSRYETLYPDWELVEGRDNHQGGDLDGPQIALGSGWSKGTAVNAAVEASSGDVLVISDADVMIGQQALRDAVGRLENSAWVVPHKLIYRLTEDATRAVIADTLYADPHAFTHNRTRAPRRGPPGGGVSVMRREDFVGMDERFIDWGGEDISFAWALDTLIGPHLRLGAVMWHLNHKTMKPPNGRASAQSEALTGRYLEASGDPVAMSELLDEQPYDRITWGGGIVVARREVVHSVPLDARYVGWG